MFKGRFYSEVKGYTADDVKARIEYGVEKPIPENKKLAVFPQAYKAFCAGLLGIAEALDRELHTNISLV